MVGIRDTLVFYTCPATGGLVLRIDNASAAFKTSGTVYLFDPEPRRRASGNGSTTSFRRIVADAPTPTLSLKLPNGSCTLKDSKVVVRRKIPPVTICSKTIR